MTLETNVCAGLMTTAARADVRGTMARLIVEATGCEETEFAPKANFFDDLEGESIDLLDLGFRAEKAFAVKSPLSAWNKSDQWKTDQNGRLTSETIAWVTAEFSRLELALPDLSRLRTVKDVCTAEFLTRLFEVAVRDEQAGTPVIGEQQ